MKKTMRIMAMVLFVIGMTTLASCTKSKEKLILGKWELTSFSISGAGYNMEMSVEDFYELMGADEEEMEDIVFEFKSDGYVYMNGERAPYSINGDQLIVEGSMYDDEEVEYETMTITELTEKALTLEKTEYVDELDGKMTIAMHFKKV